MGSVMLGALLGLMAVGAPPPPVYEPPLPDPPAPEPSREPESPA